MDQKLYEKRKNLICELVEDEFYVPMKEKELAIFMQVSPDERPQLKQILEELLSEGKLQITKRGKYLKGEGHPADLKAPLSAMPEASDLWR